MTLDGGGFTIVGVIPADFDLSTRSFRNGELNVPPASAKITSCSIAAPVSAFTESADSSPESASSRRARTWTK